MQSSPRDQLIPRSDQIQKLTCPGAEESQKARKSPRGVRSKIKAQVNWTTQKSNVLVRRARRKRRVLIVRRGCDAGALARSPGPHWRPPGPPRDPRILLKVTPSVNGTVTPTTRLMLDVAGGRLSRVEGRGLRVDGVVSPRTPSSVGTHKQKGTFERKLRDPDVSFFEFSLNGSWERSAL